ncbi:MAG: TRAP transporter small permease [Azoarcus sp.]|nr:TRAP transporter small permease [Azoarcus sp.]MDD2873963.1 TRAP transporter small permease [Azoarcus sp.]MDX9838650.1 TRAP transporter small permease [Azoarcus sp.]
MAESVNMSTVSPGGVIGRTISMACVVLAVLGGVFFLVEALMSVTSVIGRTLFNLPVPGDYELVQMLSAMGIAMCLPYCQLKRGHVFVDFFTLWAPTSLKRALDAIAALLLAVSSFLLAWRIWDGMMEMREYGETSMVIALPVWWGYIPVAPSFFLLGLAALQTFVLDLRGSEHA